MNTTFSSLTKFEVTRILVPGFYFSALLGLFLKTFAAPWLPEQPGRGGFLVFILLLLISGLSLYAKETPKRRKAFVENQPSAHLLQLSRGLGKAEPLTEEESRHLYFYILNNVMPAAFQEKIFLFGSIYYIMIQIRRTSFWFGLISLAALCIVLASPHTLSELQPGLLFTILVWLVYGLNVHYNKADRKMQENYRDQIFWLDVHRDIVLDLIKKRVLPSSK